LRCNHVLVEHCEQTLTFMHAKLTHEEEVFCGCNLQRQFRRLLNRFQLNFILKVD
jgi:hypothetical protein